jgi:toxin secretion/phage lysis holin
LESVLHREDGGFNMKYYMHQLAVGFEWKAPLSVLSALISVFEGFYSEMVWGFLGLFILDTISGIMKARKLQQPVTSRRLRDSVTKLGAYMLAITALLIASRYEPTFVPMVTLAYYYFMYTELKSIFENVEAMGLKLPDALKRKTDSHLEELDPNDEIVTKEDVKDGKSK